MACLDTSFLVDLMREQRKRMEGPATVKLLELRRRGEILSTTLFTAAELFAGVSTTPASEENQVKVEKILSLLNILPFDMSTAKLFGFIYGDLRGHGLGIGAIDTLIATIALENDEVLITRNLRHFSRVPNLKFEPY